MKICNFTIFIVFDVRGVTEGAPSIFKLRREKKLS